MDKNSNHHVFFDRPLPILRVSLRFIRIRFGIVGPYYAVQFADVTNAGFPPVYEKFLAVIGMFSMDLGWVLSAACLATGITFYVKLL